MSMMREVQAYIAKNPESGSAEIVKAFSQYTARSIQRTVCRLYDLNRATRETVGNRYVYSAEMPVDKPKEREVSVRVTLPLAGKLPRQTVITLIAKAESLMNRGLYRRAATTFMEAFEGSGHNEEREYCLRQRQRCLKKCATDNRKSEEWFLAGKFCGGDL